MWVISLVSGNAPVVGVEPSLVSGNAPVVGVEPPIFRDVLVPEVGLGSPRGAKKMEVIDFAIGSIRTFRTSDGFMVQNRVQGTKGETT